MAFIERAQDGTIKGVYAVAQPTYATEELPDTHPDVVAFRNRPLAVPRDLLAEIDLLKAKLARAEAVEAVLVQKGTLSKSDVDTEASKPK